MGLQDSLHPDSTLRWFPGRRDSPVNCSYLLPRLSFPSYHPQSTAPNLTGYCHLVAE